MKSKELHILYIKEITNRFEFYTWNENNPTAQLMYYDIIVI